MSKRKERRRERAKRGSLWRNPTFIGGTVVGIIIIGLVAYLVITREQPGEKFASEGNEHLETEPDTYIWNTHPATSGPHAPSIAPWGESDETVSPWFYIHNMEDGGVIMHYNCPDGCPGDVSELRSIVQDVGRDRLLLHPNPDMDGRIVLTAWQRMLTLDTVDREQIVDFIEAYRGVDHHR